MKVLNKKGDTIVEVMLALAVLTLLLFTAWGITNRATGISNAARLRIDMVNQLKEQAEVLKSQRAALEPSVNFATQFSSVSDTTPDSRPCTQFSSSNISNPLQQPSNSFHYAVGSGNSVEQQSGAKSVRNNPNQRVWIQKNTQPGYVDFYIQGCWVAVSGVQSFDSSFIIVRLNSQ